MKGRQLLGILILAMIGNRCFAQSKFQMLGPDTVALNQIFELRIRIDKTVDSGFKAPDMHDFELLAGPHTERTLSWIKDAAVGTTEWDYILKPKQKGNIQIDKARFLSGAAKLESNGLTISVTDSVPDTLFDELSNKVKTEVFFKLKVNKTSMEMGEKLTATYALYCLENPISWQISPPPAQKDFNAKILPTGLIDPYRTEISDGKTYYYKELAKYSLSPKHTGNLSLSRLEIKALFQIEEEVKHGLKGRIRYIPLTLKSEAVSIEVKEKTAKK